MISEKCSCGAAIEVNHGSMAGIEAADVERWRDNHKHESSPGLPSSTVYDKDWVPLSHRHGKEEYVLGEDYVLNGDNEPVWISSTRNQPLFFTQWAKSQVD